MCPWDPSTKKKTVFVKTQDSFWAMKRTQSWSWGVTFHAPNWDRKKNENTKTKKQHFLHEGYWRMSSFSKIPIHIFTQPKINNFTQIGSKSKTTKILEKCDALAMNLQQNTENPMRVLMRHVRHETALNARCVTSRCVTSRCATSTFLG